MKKLLLLLFFFSFGLSAEPYCNKSNTNSSTLYNYTFYEINESFTLQTNLLKAIEDNDIKLLNNIFKYELISSTKLKDLRKNNFELILNDAFKKAINGSKPKCNSVGARGWMLGGGTIWIQSVPKDIIQVLSVNIGR